MTVAAVRKGLVALAGAVAQAISLGVLPEAWRPWAAVALAVLTAIGVYAVPNRVDP